MTTAKKAYIQILFARPPVIGQVKTRLANFLGDQGAYVVYKEILSHLLIIFHPQGNQVTDNYLFVFSSQKENLNLLEELIKHSIKGPAKESALENSIKLYIQTNTPDLGERLNQAFLRVAQEGPAELPILIAGTDSPEYSPQLAAKAIQQLKHHDAVIGPANDGGYYLIGLNRRLAENADFLKQAFSNLSWSHNQVYANQISRLQGLGLSVASCEDTLIDIDTFADLAFYQQKQKKSSHSVQILGNPIFSLQKFMPNIQVIIPVLNEAETLGKILEKLVECEYFRTIICADNGSNDGSIDIAQNMGARVTHCKKRGYGSTCLTALADIHQRGGCDVVLFLDADGSDDLGFLDQVISPVASDQVDVCLGFRNNEFSDAGALLPHARFGNWLATTLIALFWGFHYKDLGPFRAISWSKLKGLQMDDPDFGWTIQMQIRALKKSYRILEVPVAYHKRAGGRSKISANLGASVQAGFIILRTIFRELIFSKSK